MLNIEQIGLNAMTLHKNNKNVFKLQISYLREIQIRHPDKKISFEIIPILRQQRDLMGVKKWLFLLTFSTIYADIGWVGQKKSKYLLT